MKNLILLISILSFGNAIFSQSDGDYRSIGNGDWTNTGVWQRHDGISWGAAPAPPNDTDGIISIMNGNTINVTTPISADQIVVEAGGTLYNSGGNINLVNGPGEDLSVFGTCMLRGAVIGGPGTVLIHSGGTFHVGYYALTAQTLASNLVNNGLFTFYEGYGGCCGSSVLNLSGATIQNNGTINVVASGGIYNISVNGGVLANNPGGIISSNSVYSGGNQGFLINTTEFVNNGQVTTSSGNIVIASINPAVHNGTFTNNGAESIIFSNPAPQTYAVPSAFGGTGSITFVAGTHNLSGAYLPATTMINGATVNFNQPAVNFNTLNLYSGNFSGSATKNILNTMVWTAGTVSGGEMISASGSTVYCGAGTTTQGVLATNYTNNGTTQFSNDYGGCCVGPVFTMTGSTIYNNNSIQIYGNGGIYNLTLSGGVLINNPSGVISSNTNYSVYAGDNAAFYINVSEFKNDGLLITTQGKIVIGSAVSATHSGVFTNNSASTIVFNNGGVQSYTGASSFGGTGSLTFTAGTHQLLSSYSPGSTIINGADVNFNQPAISFNLLYLYGGTLGGSATKSIASVMHWTAGIVSGGELINTPAGTVYLGAGSTSQGTLNATFTNNGYTQLYNNYGGCCVGPIFNMPSGVINNNATFDFISGYGIYYIGISGGTFNNNATGIVNCFPGTYYNIVYLTPTVLTSAGVINITDTRVAVPNCTLGGQININSAGRLESGTVSFNGSAINNNGAVIVPSFIFSGSASQTVSGSGYFEVVEMNGNGGVVLNSNLNLNSALILTNGKITTGNYRVVAGTASVSSGNTNSYIAGTLSRYYPGGNVIRDFPVGTNSAFAPLNVSFYGISNAGNLVASITSGDHPSIGSSGINVNRSVNAHWQLINEGLIFNFYDVVFNWPNSLRDVIADPLFFNIRKYVTGTWQYVAESNLASNSITGSGITSFGQFQIAEVGCDSDVYYRDQDNDGYGNPGDSIVSCVAVPGYVLNNQDCNDSNALIKPGANEICGNGIDEDCDGLVDEGCGQASNDSPFNATLIVLSGNSYPYCGVLTGSLANASDSPQSTSYNGPDAWYRFVAASPSVSITMNGLSGDNIIVLHDNSLTLVSGNNTANDQGIGGAETLFYNNLTVGQQYFVSVGSIGGTAAAYTICLRQLMPSFCANGSTEYSLCANLKPQWTGATSYTFNITPTGGTTGSPVSITMPGQLALSTPSLALQYGGTYQVRIDANYLNLTYPNNNPAPPVTVIGLETSNISIAPHLIVDTKIQHQCPAAVLKRTILQAKPFVCGAENFTVEFTRVSACSSGIVVDLPFEVLTPGTTSNLPLGFIAPQPLINNNYYRVRWRPNFTYGSGNWGPYSTIYLSGSVMYETESLEEINTETKSDINVVETAFYPNPFNGEGLNVNVTDIESDHLTIRVTDALGRVVYHRQYAVAETFSTLVLFERPLASGFYLAEINVDGKVYTEKLVVDKQ